MQFSKTLICFLCLFNTLAFSWNISSESLLEKLQKEPPQWMQKRIENDLSYFHKGLSSHEIELCLENLSQMQGSDKAGLARIQFSNGIANVSPLHPLNAEQKKYAEEFISAINLLHSISPISNLDLLLCASYSFDRPLLLLQTSAPIFAVSKEKHNNKVALIPRLCDAEREITFQTLYCDWGKKREKAFWRGFATDGNYGRFEWDCKPRAILALLSQQNQDILDAAIVPSSILDNWIKNWMNNLSLVSDFIPAKEQCCYKYLLSLDGVASPSSLEWQLFTQSLVFKAESNRIEWYFDELQSGLHYIPFHPRSIDLIEKIMWAQTHDEKAQSIAENGYQFAREHLLDEELLVYLYHLLAEYSRLFF